MCLLMLWVRERSVNSRAERQKDRDGRKKEGLHNDKASGSRVNIGSAFQCWKACDRTLRLLCFFLIGE